MAAEMQNSAPECHRSCLALENSIASFHVTAVDGHKHEHQQIQCHQACYRNQYEDDGSSHRFHESSSRTNLASYKGAIAVLAIMVVLVTFIILFRLFRNNRQVSNVWVQCTHHVKSFVANILSPDHSRFLMALTLNPETQQRTINGIIRTITVHKVAVTRVLIALAWYLTLSKITYTRIFSVIGKDFRTLWDCTVIRSFLTWKFFVWICKIRWPTWKYQDLFYIIATRQTLDPISTADSQGIQSDPKVPGDPEVSEKKQAQLSPEGRERTWLEDDEIWPSDIGYVDRTSLVPKLRGHWLQQHYSWSTRGLWASEDPIPFLAARQRRTDNTPQCSPHSTPSITTQSTPKPAFTSSSQYTPYLGLPRPEISSSSLESRLSKSPASGLDCQTKEGPFDTIGNAYKCPTKLQGQNQTPVAKEGCGNLEDSTGLGFAEGSYVGRKTKRDDSGGQKRKEHGEFTKKEQCNAKRVRFATKNKDCNAKRVRSATKNEECDTKRIRFATSTATKGVAERTVSPNDGRKSAEDFLGSDEFAELGTAMAIDDPQPCPNRNAFQVMYSEAAPALSVVRTNPSVYPCQQAFSWRDSALKGRVVGGPWKRDQTNNNVMDWQPNECNQPVEDLMDWQSDSERKVLTSPDQAWIYPMFQLKEQHQKQDKSMRLPARGYFAPDSYQQCSRKERRFWEMLAQEFDLTASKLKYLGVRRCRNRQER